MNNSLKLKNTEILDKKKLTACIAFSSGECLFGMGFGHEGTKVAELCFNTAMTGYQEILTDLSYAGQIVNFTFPYIGNTGTNTFDNESSSAVVKGMISRNLPTQGSSWRSENSFQAWLKKNKITGIAGVDTRKITRLIRANGAQIVAICFSKLGSIDVIKLQQLARAGASLKGMELTASVTCEANHTWTKNKTWTNDHILQFDSKKNSPNKSRLQKIVAIDYGAKHTIFDQLTNWKHQVFIVPANYSFEKIMELEPDGIFLSNGPGDPNATFEIFGKSIIKLIKKTKVPIFGICLGHQLLGIALGATTIKMTHGHHGANHPVRNIKTGKIEITSMNHGFAINTNSLPVGVYESHVSLFDGTNCGIEVPNRKIFSVQYHPESSPGPHDSYYLFEKFFNNIYYS